MATITLDKTTIKAGETAVVTFTVELPHTMGTILTPDGVRRVTDVTITGGTLTADYGFRWIPALDTATTRSYQTTFTPTPNLDRTECRISYNPSGTANDATSAIFIVDTRAPTLTGTPTIGNPNLTRANQVTTISFVFHEQLNQASFTTADLTIPAGMGTLEDLRTTDGGRSWQVDLRAPANLAANSDAKGLQIGINMAGITDVAGNSGTGNVNLVTYNLDNKPPSATIVVTPNPVTASNDRLVTVVITFDEAVTGFTVANIDFNNAHVTRYGINPVGELNRSADGRNYTITYTAAPDTEDATNTISLRLLDTIRDAVNNAATVSPTSNNYVIDTKDPVPTSITLDKERLIAGETATVTVTFNEIVSGFTAAAIQIANGSVSNLTQDTTDGRIWRATFTPTANLDRISFERLAVNLDGITDRVGNASNGTYVIDNPTPIVIDTKPPEVAVTISDNRLAAGESATITFTFSERVTGFDLNDVQYDTSKGTLGALTAVGTDGKVWSASYMPQPGSESAENTIRVNLSGVQDAQGNAGVGTGTSGNFSIDTKPPSATIVVTPNPVTAGNDRLVTVTITFDEAVTGFTVANIDFNNAHVTRYGINPVGELNRSADGRTYTITYTAAPDTEDATNTISLRLLDTIRDAANNAATVSPTSNNYVIDTKDPVPTSITLDKERLTAGDTATITVTFNEIVSGFTAAAFEIANGSVSNLTQDTTDGRIWRATFTPTANLARTSFDRLAVNLDGLTDRVGNGGNGTEVRSNPTPIVIDTKVFVVNTATVNGKQLVLQYSDETMLDPDQAHNAPGDAF